MLTKLRHSLGAKILAVVLVSTFVALVVATAALLWYEVDNYRSFLRDDLQTQADILARTTAPALAFNDPAGAQGDLAVLERRPSLEAAALYNANGEIVATYSRAGEVQNWPEAGSPEQIRIEGDSLVLFHPVIESGNRLGTIYLRARYDLGARALAYFLILISVMGIALGSAGLISIAVIRSVARPLRSITQIARGVVNHRDFSRRAEKSSEDEIGVLVDAFNSMLHEVGARTAELELINRTLQRESETRRQAEFKLREADRRKDEFLATLAHELRNPMAPMRNSLSLLQSSKADPADSRRGLEILERQLSHLAHLVDDLLDVSRITSGKLKIQKEVVSLAGIVGNAVETVEPQLEANSNSIRIELPDSPLYVVADPSRLAQVLGNLLNNAIKFSEPAAEIALTARADADLVRIDVADRGAGIAADALGGVFEMFAQGEQANHQGQTGLGVGLALARQLIELHGGTIEADSEGLGRGSTFSVSVPRADAPAEEPAIADLEPEPPARPARVLIVDDNADYASSLALLLSSVGHEVRVANTGEEALALAGELTPEVGILDIGLPDIGGRDLARRLRTMAGVQKPVLIAISGWGQPEDRQQSLDAGFSLHLVKPVDYRTIQAAMREFCQELPR